MPHRVRQRVSLLDLPGLPLSIALACGPIEAPTPDAFAAMLRRLAAQRPEYRFFSLLDRERALWLQPAGAALDRHCDEMVVGLPSPMDDWDAALHELLVSHSAARPATFVVGPDFVAAVISHAIGDGTTNNSTVPELIRAALEGGTPTDIAAPGVAHPLARATTRFFGGDPRRVAALLRSSRPTPAGATALPQLAERRLPRFISARSKPGYVSALRELRASRPVKVSTPSLLFAATTRLMRAEGVVDKAGMMVLVDCRRYLRGGPVWGNFISGTYLSPADPSSAEDVNAAIRAALATGRPLAALAVAATRTTLRGRTRTRDSGGGSGAVLSLSHLGELRAYRDLPWLAADRRYLAGNTSERVDRIAVNFSELDDALHVTATFDDRTYSEAALGRVVAALCDDPRTALVDRPACP
jgi:hypothetical protein